MPGHVMLLDKFNPFGKKTEYSIIEKEIKEQEKAFKKEYGTSIFYNIMSHLPIVGRYMRTMERALYTLCPYNEIQLMKLATLALAKVIGLSALLTVVNLLISYIASKKITFFSLLLIFFTVYFVGKEVLQSTLSKVDDKINSALVSFIETVKHNYTSSKNIPRSILDAADDLNDEMSLHAREMYNILIQANRRDLVQEYASSPDKNKYLKKILSQAYEASERGNATDESGNPLFAKNMELMRIEILNEIRLKEKRKFEYSGYTFVTVVPLFFTELIEKWGLDFSDGLTGFYSGPGEFIKLFAFLATIIIYDLVNKAKFVHLGTQSAMEDRLSMSLSKSQRILDAAKRLENSRKGFLYSIKEKLVMCKDNTPSGIFLIKMFITGIAMFFCVLVFVGAIHVQEKNRLLTDPSGFEIAVSSANERLKQAIYDTALQTTKEWCEIGDVTPEQIEVSFRSKLFLTNKTTVDEVVREITKRIDRYQNQYLHWWEYLIAVILAVAASFLPYMSLSYKYNIIMQGRDNEVKQFQSIVLMERHFADITVLSLLEKMEAVAVSYKPALRECINNYKAGPQEALEELKHAANGNLWFNEIINSLIDADKVGIRTAFDAIKHNKEAYEKEKEIQDDIGLSKKKDATEILALIPSVVIVGIFFIIPFFFYAFADAGNLFVLMDELQNAGF